MMSAMDAPDPVSLRDGGEHVEPPDHTAEPRICTVEMRLGRVGDEELAAARVGPGESHPHGTHVVAHRGQLVPQHEPRPAPPGPPWIAALGHEVGNDPMPRRSVKV